ncbi:hypothetical protein C8J31_102307 [Rhizobium sp. PP-CC-2G-626]|nr:hypothetical protein C8J31_102307 [Rhizobium sp. PP-CC-2G-626]
MTKIDTMVLSASAGGFDKIVRIIPVDDVARLPGSVADRSTLARNGANRLWKRLREEASFTGLDVLSGNQAKQVVRARLPIDG